MTARKAPVIEYEEHWLCQSCDSQQEPARRSRADMMAHLREAHGFTASPIHGKRSLVMHLDEARAYFSTYEWTLDLGADKQDALKLFQYETGPRHGR